MVYCNIHFRHLQLPVSVMIIQYNEEISIKFTWLSEKQILSIFFVTNVCPFSAILMDVKCLIIGNSSLAISSHLREDVDKDVLGLYWFVNLIHC